MSTIFKDTSGHEFCCSVTAGTVIEYRKRLDVNLNSLIDGNLLDRMATDIELFVNMLWLSVKASAPEGMDDAAFAEVLGGDVLESARDALLEAIISFFPALARGPLQKMRDKGKAVQVLALNQVNQAIDNLTPEMMIGLKNPVGNSQASSG
jgi:hypothetical protein